MANIHPKLVHFNTLSWCGILESEETARQLFVDMGVAPDPKDCPPCSSCGAATIARKDKSRRHGFMITCTTCKTKISPGKNTFFENLRLPFRDIFAVIVLFVLKFSLTSALEHLCAYRRSIEAKSPTMSSETAVSLYATLREVAEIIASHHCWPMGGPGKTILPFITTKKYRIGCQAQPEIYNVVGFFCKEDKDGIFLMMTDGQKKKDLLPLIKSYCHINASVGRYSDTKQRHGSDDHGATVPTIALKNGSHQASKSHMALDIYRRKRLQPFEDDGSRIDQFLRDIAAVFPGWRREGLRLRKIEIFSPKSYEELRPSCRVLQPCNNANLESSLKSDIKDFSFGCDKYDCLEHAM